MDYPDEFDPNYDEPALKEMPPKLLSSPAVLDIYYNYGIRLPTRQFRRLSKVAVVKGDVAMVKYIHKYYPKELDYSSLLKHGLAHASYDTITTLIELGKVDFRGKVVDDYVGGGVEICEYLLKRGGRFTKEALVVAASLFRSKVFKFLENQGLNYDLMTMREALKRKSCQLADAETVADLKFFLERQLFAFDDLTLSSAGFRQCNIIMFLIRNNCPITHETDALDPRPYEERASSVKQRLLQVSISYGHYECMDMILTDLKTPITAELIHPILTSEPGLYEALPFLERYIRLLPMNQFPFPDKERVLEVLKKTMEHSNRRLYKWITAHCPYKRSEFYDNDLFADAAPWYQLNWKE